MSYDPKEPQSRRNPIGNMDYWIDEEKDWNDENAYEKEDEYDEDYEDDEDYYENDYEDEDDEEDDCEDEFIW